MRRDDLRVKNSSTEQTAVSPSSSGCALTPKFVAVEPLQLIFEPNNKMLQASIKITSMNPNRIAWRIRTNAPTRYVVLPTSGFLTANANVTSRITLIDPRKYHRRHRFMVQAMEAKDNEKDRKKIWDDERAMKLDVVQSIRISTSETSSLKTAAGISSSTKSLSSVSTNKGQQLSESSASNLLNASTNSSTSDSSESLPFGPVSDKATNAPAADDSDFDCAQKIEELTEKVKIAMSEKVKESQKLIDVVNEVKKIEVDLDRTGAQCKDYNDKVAYEEAQCKVSISTKMIRIVCSFFKSLSSKNLDE
ncbi:unnamed protein product [Anisakis simplex]|uniref:Major sperm protein n=1 Tax=Anisakis simplex TaxID=6269 RepID=A0A158PNN9_ANISI|nr:unnamed protein product [Anisakis simplex]